jgi:outer membrane protein OmpU
MNIKKIGLTALAGSLAMVSANAVELAVTGKTEVTYMTNDIESTGNPFGMGNAISFNGSGDVNGMTASYFAAIQDNGAASSTTSEVFASSSLMLDMGDMGTVGFDQGVGEFGVGTIDDMMPYAYEEIWNHTGLNRGLRAAGDTNALGYKNTYMGYNLSVELDPGHGAGSANGDSGSTGVGTTDKGYNFAVTTSSLYEGLNTGFGYGTEEHGDTLSDSENADETYATVFAKYAFGGATVGYQMAQGRGGSAGTVAHDVQIMGASFSVNENLSVSVNQMDIDFIKGGEANVEETTRGIGVSYTMGSAAIRIVSTEVENKAGEADELLAPDVQQTELSLMLAF